MTPIDTGHFTDMDGNALEDAPQPERAPSAAAAPINWSSSAGARKAIRTRSYHVGCLKCGSNGPQGATQLEAAKGWDGRKG